MCHISHGSKGSAGIELMVASLLIVGLMITMVDMFRLMLDGKRTHMKLYETVKKETEKKVCIEEVARDGGYMYQGVARGKGERVTRSLTLVGEAICRGNNG